MIFSSSLFKRKPLILSDIHPGSSTCIGGNGDDLS